MKYLIFAPLCMALTGCMSLGLQNMDAAQIRATEGIASCSEIYTMQGHGRSVIVHNDAAKRGLDSTIEIVIGADCTTTIRGTGGIPKTITPAPLPAR